MAEELASGIGETRPDYAFLQDLFNNYDLPSGSEFVESDDETTGMIPDSAEISPRLSHSLFLSNITDRAPNRGMQRGKHNGRAQKGRRQHGTLPPLGYEGGQFPLYLSMPKEPYYKEYHTRKQYPPLSLMELQRMIDTGLVDPSQPIDLTTLCNTKVYGVNVEDTQYGVNLTDEGADIFDAKVNLEVQWTSEVAIAAIEKNGGTILTKFYDKISVDTMQNPMFFFQKGLPIPHCKLPTEDCLGYYSNPQNRGYLSDPQRIDLHRHELAQKFGYHLPDITKDQDYEMLKLRKDPRQIWYGLEPGWVINVRDRSIIKPKDERLKAFYKS